MTSSIENNRMSRREFIKILRNTAAGVALLGPLGTALEACAPRSPDVSKPSSEIVGLPVVIEMPFGAKFIVETIPPHPRLNLNKTLTEKLLSETVKKPTAPIKVSLYSDDWLRVQPDKTLLGIDDQRYQSLSQEEKDTFRDSVTTTLYDPTSGIPQGVAVHIATGRFLKEARRGNNMIVQNEFIPEGIIVDPIIALNATFYHEVRYHALLRNSDYRPQDETGRIQEELTARKGETEWVKSLAAATKLVKDNQLFLVPH